MPALPVPPTTARTRSRLRTAFRVLAVVEAVTWAGLLVGMLLEHVLHVTDLGVYLFGRLHGGAFLLYGAAALATWGVQQWSWRVGLLGLLAALPPFGTVVLEMWVRRRGLLDDVPAPTRAGRRPRP